MPMRLPRPVAPPLRAALLLPILLLAAPAPSGAQAGAAAARPRVGLVLGGGGAKGAAHVGVLKVLEELQVPIDFIAGTSMGAIVGGAYASGMTAAELERELSAIDWDDLFHDLPPRRELSFRRKKDDRDRMIRFEVGISGGRFQLPEGLIVGQRIGLALRRLTLRSAGVESFDELPIPFRAVATDIETGEMVVLDRGDLPAAIQASMAVPGVLAPVAIGGRRLVDGGLVRNLPVDVVRRMGAEVVIVVDVGSARATAAELRSVLGITSQVVTLMTRGNGDQQLGEIREGDLLVRPDLDGLGSAGFGEVLRAAERGEQAARALAARLALLSDPAAAPGRIAYLNSRRSAAPRVDFLRLENHSRLADPVVQRLLAVREGAPLDPDALQAALSRLYGLGGLEKASYRLVREGERLGVVVELRERPWGRDALRFGLALNDDSRGNSGYTLFTSYGMTQLNRLGGEARLQLQLGRSDRAYAELFQPVEPAGRVFVSPWAEALREFTAVHRGGYTVAEYRTSADRVGVDVGMLFGGWGEGRVGVRAGRVEADPEVGDSSQAEFHLRQVAATARFEVDRLDDLSFPTHGEAALVQAASYRAGLGTELAYDRVEASVLRARSRGPHTLLLSADAGTGLGSRLPVYDEFALGGFLRLSGLPPRQLAGRHYGLARAVYFRTVGDGSDLGPVGRLRVGGTLELGGAWTSAGEIGWKGVRHSAAALAGLGTVLGPLYFAYAVAEGGSAAWYLVLGRAF